KGPMSGSGARAKGVSRRLTLANRQAGQSESSAPSLGSALPQRGQGRVGFIGRGPMDQYQDRVDHP
ncbi:MAG: hypothetical protein ACI841_002551, partial [Planctomycetota bacterium]